MTDAIKAFKVQRKQVKGSLTRCSTYLAGLNVSDVSVIELRQRLQKVSDLWQAFHEAQSAIEELEPEEANEPIHLEERDTFENRYFAVTVQLETLIDRKIAATRPPQSSFQSNSTSNLPNYRGGTPASPGSNFPNEHLKLPRVTLPTFSGKYEQWIPFRNMFLSMIHENPMLPNAQKMQYLMSALTGDAKEVISSLEASDEDYPEAWEMLKERYDDDSLIIQRHVRALFEQPVLLKENHLELRQLLDNVLKHLRALKALKRPTDQWNDILIYLVTSRLDQTTSKEWETTLKKGEIPTFDRLTDFLAQRCRALEASSRNQRATLNSQKVSKSDKNKSTSAHVATTNVMCAYCGKADHPIYKCATYLELEVDKRIKEARSRKLCLNCLKVASHQAKQCGSGSCRKCNKRHNTLLHLEQVNKPPETDNMKTATPPDKEHVISTSVNHAAVSQDRQVILATAIVNILDAKGTLKPCRALLDNGSQSCFITTKCVKKLGIKQYSTSIPIFGVGELTTQTRGIAKVTMQSRINGFQAKLDCLIIEKITQVLPANHLNPRDLKIPDGITLADPEFNHPAEVDLLLGAEIFLDLLCIGKIKLASDQPVWQKTLLGWIVSGNFMAREQPRNATICNLSINEQLNANLSRFWQMESVERRKTRTPEERICEGHFTQTYKRNAVDLL